MPYIAGQATREAITKELKPIIERHVQDVGTLNFVITTVIDLFIKRLSYSTINTVVGVLECVKLEFYRRIAAPYETMKRDENGDVYLPEHIFHNADGNDV